MAADLAPSGVTAPAAEPGAADLPAPQADADGGPATQAWQMGADAPGAGADDEASGTHGDGDPYFAELRRAVDQPEPLGPRDDDSASEGTGEDDGDPLYDEADGRRLGGRLRRRH